MRIPVRSPAFLAVTALLALGALQRTWNVLEYPVFMGFDAKGNWQYIELLMQRWALPSPEDGWSTAHPPLFYAIGAALGALQDSPDEESVGRPTVLLCAALGLAAVAASAWLVHRLSRGNGRRVVLAAALLVFLPVHISMSAMLSEELLTSALVSLAVVGLSVELTRPEDQRRTLWRPLGLGAIAGMALLTKLSAVMAILAGTLALLAEGSSRTPSRAVRTALVFASSASVIGGWFYLRNLLMHGYLYPHGLGVHAVMLDMPPGGRGVLDYVSFPLAAFSAAQAADPPLLHSIWASTYASIWFDPHRHFLPRHADGLEIAARVILVTALLPTAAFVVGVVRGARRAWREHSGVDRVLVALVALTLGGYIAFTWRNPWFVTAKGSFLLGLATPFAVYASEVLDGWLSAGPRSKLVLGSMLALLFATSTATFTYQGFFEKWEPPGPAWRSVR